LFGIGFVLVGLLFLPVGQIIQKATTIAAYINHFQISIPNFADLNSINSLKSS
jgi:hypothetical protein